MKSKESPNLYEILKATSPRRGETPSTVQARTVETEVPPDIEAPEASEPIAETPAVTTTPPAPRPEPKPEPKPTPVRQPSPSLASSIKWPGDRVINLSLNTVIFIVLAGAGLLFIAYALGVRSGKAGSTADKPEKPLRAAATDAEEGEAESLLTDNPEGRIWTIRLTDWDANRAQNRLIGEKNAETLTKGLRRRGLKSAWYRLEERNGKKLIVLRYGKFKERDTEETRALMRKLVGFRWRKTAIFAKSAGMEAVESD